MWCPRAAWAGLLFLLVIGLSGCQNFEFYSSTQGSLADPYRFGGKVEPQDLESKREELGDLLDQWGKYELKLQQQNERALYEITMDGEGACNEARDAVRDLEFILSSSSCAQVD